jgi:HK97 family phage prohead protease
MSTRRTARFSESARMELTFTGSTDAEFAVDVGRREITGLAVPWGESATSNGRKFRFAAGVLKYAAVNRVKLLRDHDRSQVLGRATRLTETPEGLVATFKVSPGRAGDEALALAADEVLDGLSIGVDFRDEDLVPDPMHPGGYLATTAALREISLTAFPAFDSSRLTSVRASDTGKETRVDKCERCGAKLSPGVAHTCSGQGVQFSMTPELASEFAGFMAGRARSSAGEPKNENDAQKAAGVRTNEEVVDQENGGRKNTSGDGTPNYDTDEEAIKAAGRPERRTEPDKKHPEGRTGTATTWPGRSGDDKVVNADPPQDAQFSASDFAAFMAWKAGQRPTVDPTRRGNPHVQVREALPYTFSRPTAKGEMQFSANSPHNFHSDLYTMFREGDDGQDPRSDAAKRVMSLLKATFDVDTADVNELSPNIQRPDMYVDQRDYRRPIFDIIGRGAPTAGGTPFTFPKFSSASGLVGNHTEGVEPASGTFVTTDQTITPSGLSGKASITREAWTRPGNPATASLIWNQMVRGYWEGMESAAATFLNTLTAAADILLTAGASGTTLTNLLESELAKLQFVRGYDFSAMVLEAVLYGQLNAATDSSGRKVYPIYGPQNANGQARSRFQTLDIAGYEGIPSWALASTPGSPNNSWIFDPTTVYGWASAPERLEFAGTNTTGGYAPVAMIDLAIWGWKAFANTDIGGVRQVIYDSVP